MDHQILADQHTAGVSVFVLFDSRDSAAAVAGSVDGDGAQRLPALSGPDRDRHLAAVSAHDLIQFLPAHHYFLYNSILFIRDQDLQLFQFHVVRRHQIDHQAVGHKSVPVHIFPGKTDLRRRPVYGPGRRVPRLSPEPAGTSAQISCFVLRLDQNAVFSLFLKSRCPDFTDILHAFRALLLRDPVIFTFFKDPRAGILVQRDFPALYGRHVVLGNDKRTLRVRVIAVHNFHSAGVLRKIVDRPEPVHTEVPADPAPVSGEITSRPVQHADPVCRFVFRQIRQDDGVRRPHCKRIRHGALFFVIHGRPAPALHHGSAGRKIPPGRVRRAGGYILVLTQQYRRDRTPIGAHLAHRIPVKTEPRRRHINDKRIFVDGHCGISRQIHAGAVQRPLPILRKGHLRLVDIDRSCRPPVPFLRHSPQSPCVREDLHGALIRRQIGDAHGRAARPVVVPPVSHIFVVPDHLDPRRNPVDHKCLRRLSRIGHRRGVPHCVRPAHFQRVLPVCGKSDLSGPQIGSGPALPFSQRGSRRRHDQLPRVKIPLPHLDRRLPRSVKIVPVPHLIVIISDMDHRCGRIDSQHQAPAISRVGAVPRVVRCDSRHFYIIALPLASRRDANFCAEPVDGRIVASICQLSRILFADRSRRRLLSPEQHLLLNGFSVDLHRAVYFLQAGCAVLPVRIGRQDFQINRPIIQASSVRCPGADRRHRAHHSYRRVDIHLRQLRIQIEIHRPLKRR